MRPKEKAIELTDRYLQCIIFTIKQEIKASVIEAAKQCALIAVDEMIEQIKKFKFMIHHEYEIMYLNRVKEEIEKL
jgi:hypothetical protein